MAKASGLGTKASLWRPEAGIRFSCGPSPTPHPSPGSLYPRLDISRFFQTASHDDVEAGSRPLKEVSDADEGQLDKDVSNAESNDTCIESTQLPSVTSSAADVEGRHPTTPVEFTQTLEQSSSSVKISLEEDQPEEPPGFEPPLTSLSFNISADLFHAARSAKAGSDDSFWSYTMYERKSAAGTTEKVQVHYCTTHDAMESICKEYFVGEKVLGFDIEWCPFATRDHRDRDKVSLIQIASPDRIALFHVAVFPDTDDLVSPTFRQIMEDSAVSKVGVQIRGDCSRVRNFLGVDCRGIFELSHLYKQVKFTEAKTPRLINKLVVSLSTQVQDVLGLPLFKGDAVRSSNWMKRLDRQQILYSASDAYAGIQLYHVLEAKRKALNPCPERPYHIELELPIPTTEPKPKPKARAAGGTRSITVSTPEGKLLAQTAHFVFAGKNSKLQNALVAAADDEAATYRMSHNCASRPASLRAYFLWHTNHDLRPDTMAEMLRDPPLKTSTVVSYIMDAILVDKLPFDKSRMQLELLPLLKDSVKWGRYRGVVIKCGRPPR